MNVKEAAKDTIQINQFIEREVPPVKNPEGKGTSHAKWMLEEIIKKQMSKDKQNRWLGYAQAILVQNGLTTLDQLKDINKNNT